MMRQAMVVGLGLLVACGPVQAADGTGYARYEAGSGRGVVSVTPTSLAFQFFGLRANTKYRLVISSNDCSAGKGVIVSRSFRTTSRGSTWDPAPVRAAATPRSAKLLRGKRVVGCTAMNPPLGVINTIKIRNASPSVVVVDQATSTSRVMASVTGLRKNGQYRLVGLDRPCAREAQVVLGKDFAANRRGEALVDASSSAVSGQRIQSVAVVQSGSAQIVFCKTL